MPTNCFPFTVRVSRQKNFVSFFCQAFKFFNQILRRIDYLGKQFLNLLLFLFCLGLLFALVLACALALGLFFFVAHAGQLCGVFCGLDPDCSVVPDYGMRIRGYEQTPGEG